MPTYTVTNSNFTLNSKQQNNLAEGITKVHNVVTGANTYFAQVIFNKTEKNNHFMGGKKVKEPSIFLLGQIRAGRPKKTKDKLISDLRDIIIKNSKLDQTQVWVYIVDLPPSLVLRSSSPHIRHQFAAWIQGGAAMRRQFHHQDLCYD